MTWLIRHRLIHLPPMLYECLLQKSLDVTVGYPEVRSDVDVLNVVSKI